VRRTALVVTEQILVRQICRKLVFGLGKRGEWHGWEVDQACSMYSLSLAADDNAALYTEARNAMAASLGEPAAPAADPRIEQARDRFVRAMDELLCLLPQPK
jgi:hypothetical protein